MSSNLKEDLINHISSNNLAFVKYQQRDEDELNLNQRKIIAENLLKKSTTMFLNRFGKLLQVHHFEYFDHIDFNDKSKKEMIKKQIKNLRWGIENKQLVIRNRRFACMQKMIKEENSYFSEDEMIHRDPELYESLVGQYMSIAEKQARTTFDPRTSSLVDILFNSIDKQDEQKEVQNDKSDSSDDESSREAQWGNFEGENKNVRKRKIDFIPKLEREVLKKEWIGIMQNNFIKGKDSEHFDYSQVDENEEFDETMENDQDCQDKYFNEDEEEEDCEKIELEQEDEDDLDVYMKHIENHIKKQNENSFTEEFDDE